MNKREKETLQLQLEAEEDVLKELEKQYQKALKDIDEKIKFLQTDELTQSRIYQIQYQKALRGQIEGIIEKLHSDEYTTLQQYLNSAYTDAFVATAYNLAGQGIPLIMPIDQKAAVKAIITDSKIKEDLYTALGVDSKALKKAIRQEITRGIASGMSYHDIARNISEVSKAPLSRAKTIARTESHRIQQASTHDAQQAAKKRGADVVKQWDSTLDGKTRSTHRHLDGQIKEIDETFELGGKKAMYPGEFGDPAEDCNCRCVSLTRARWALDDDELKTLQERAEFFGLSKEKAKTFEEFQEKYLKSLEYRSIVGDGSIELVPVTESSYTNLAKNLPGTWEENQKEALKQACTDLLKEAEGLELGTECGLAYSKDTFELLEKIIGKSNTVSLPRLDIPYIVIHNHPDGLTFSGRDITSFLGSGDLAAVFAIGNDGSVYLLEKTENYAAADFLKAFFNMKSDYPNMMDSPTDYVNAMREFLKGAEKYGVKYYEGKS